METKHTPGPWKVGKTGSPIGIHVRIYNFDGLYIAEANGGMSDVRANAELIAQAPDLLAKVSELKGLLNDVLNDVQYADHKIDKDLYNEIKKALES